jgi:MFS family permease
MARPFGHPYTVPLTLPFLTYFLQVNLGFSPLKTGLAFLPLSAVLVITSTTVQTRVIQRTGVKPLVLLGMALGVVGMLLFTQLTPTSSYGTGVLPGLLVLGVGMGCISAPAFSAGTLGVPPNEAGIASAMVNTSQQIGGSIGTSLLSTIYASAVASDLATHLHVRGLAATAQVHGDTTAFWWAAGIFGLGLLLVLLIVPSRCEARTATTLVALARHAIGNCDFDESPDGAAVTDGSGSPERLWRRSVMTDDARIRELMLMNLFAVFNERAPERRLNAIAANYTEDSTEGRLDRFDKTNDLLDIGRAEA